MAESYPVVEMAIQRNSPTIEMTLDKSGPHEIQVALYSRSRGYMARNGPVTVLNPGQSLSFDLPNVPSGYTCIGYNEAHLEDTTGQATVLCGNSATVILRNDTGQAIYSTGTTQVGSETYYTFSVRATLIGVKNGVL